MQNHNDEQTQSQSWSDPRYLFSPVIPCVFILFGGALIVLPFYFTKNFGLAEIVITVAAVSGGLYFTYCAFQLLFIELNKKFIAHHIKYEAGIFNLRGYYFKKTNFKKTELEKVEPYVISERFFSKNMGTLLSRNNRFTILSGKNVNLKITLKNGREFYFPGEMGRPGQWKPEDVKELRSFMEACIGK